MLRGHKTKPRKPAYCPNPEDIESFVLYRTWKKSLREALLSPTTPSVLKSRQL
jgi:hypothetical protein